MGAGCSSSRNSNAQDPDRRGNGALRRGSNASSRSSSDSPVQELNGDVGGADKKRGLRKDFSSAADVIIEKAKDFWKELKDLPIPATDGMSYLFSSFPKNLTMFLQALRGPSHC